MRLVTAATAAALLLLAGATTAQDATYALDAKERYEAGDVYTDVVEENSENNVVVTLNGQVLQKNEEKTKTTYESVTKVLEVDADGRATKVLVYFKSFAVSEGGFDDDTLKGKVILIESPAGKPAKWRHHAGPGNIASTAETWLTGQMSAWRNSVEEQKAARAFKPKQPVKVGESWTPDLEQLMKSAGMPVDQGKAKGSCTLTKIEDRKGVELAHVTMKATLPVSGFPGMEGMQVQWTKGGAMEFTFKGTMPTAARIAPGEEESVYHLDGEANMQGATVSLKVKGVEKSTRTLTGAIPELERIPEAEAKSGQGESEEAGEAKKEEKKEDDGMGGGR